MPLESSFPATYCCLKAGWSRPSELCHEAPQQQKRIFTSRFPENVARRRSRNVAERMRGPEEDALRDVLRRECALAVGNHRQRHSLTIEFDRGERAAHSHFDR